MNNRGSYSFEDGVVLCEGRIYIPDVEPLRQKLIKLHHDSITVGHPGRFRTAELLLRNYWWPRLQVDVRNYVTKCDLCQRTKPLRTKPRGLLLPNSIPTKPFECISIDLIVDLPISNGFDSVVVIVDRFSKFVRLTPCNKSLSSPELATLFRDNYWRTFGLPEVITSDRGSIFISEFTSSLNELLGINTNISSAFHPQTDGQTERVNQEVEQFIRLYTNWQQDAGPIGSPSPSSLTITNSLAPPNPPPSTSSSVVLPASPSRTRRQALSARHLS
ncbi:hypothetical protein NMY22_g19805 [Coprinellus aureogranulatus]|nr:hypothetical protein NMY22_g19805 [Coprinellus aureogranulatus]